MADELAYEDLIKLVDKVKVASSQPVCTFAGSKLWALELKHHKDRFYRNENNELMWLGTKVVVTYGDDNFWSIADKIIPKENNKCTE